MKKLILLALFLVPVASNLSSNSTLETSDIVLQIQNLSPEQNVQVIEFFQSDLNYKVINTCSLLGLIVFEPKESVSMSRMEGEAYLQHKLQRLLVDKSMVIEENISKGQVNQLCREKVASMQAD